MDYGENANDFPKRLLKLGGSGRFPWV